MKTITFEIKSVNSRNVDVRFKLPNTYRTKELELRRLITEHAGRGKLDVLVTVNSEAGDEDYSFNEPLFRMYYNKLSEIQGELGTNEDIMAAILRMPNIIKPNDETVSDDEWQKVIDLVMMGMEDLKEYRRLEGEALMRDFKERVTQISASLEKIEPLEERRLSKVKDRIRKNLADFDADSIDENRFEQELIYYLEKMDITEEKVRLKQHCDYFLESLNNDSTFKGKVLNFISQEMGREINTLGAKAGDSEIQKHVVTMKDALEKIKEQIANVV